MPVSTDDALRVPTEYETQVLYRWGDPAGMPDAMPAFKADASNTAAEQALQAGMHHDGMHFFPLPRGSKESGHGLLVMNHEYLDEGLLFPDGQKTWSLEKVLKEDKEQRVRAAAAAGLGLMGEASKEALPTLRKVAQESRSMGKAAQPLAQAGPARLARQHDRDAGSLEVRDESFGLGRLAATVRPVDGDEAAASRGLAGGCHRRRV